MKRVRIVASALVCALTLTSVCVGTDTEAGAAKKTSLSIKSKSIAVGDTVKIKLKNGKKKAKVTWKTSDKKVAKITKKSGKGKSAYATVKGFKKGKAKITAVYKLGKTTTSLICNIKVSGSKKKADTTPTPNILATGTPSAAPAPTTDTVQTPSPSPSAKPSAKPKPTPTVKPSPTPTPVPTPTPYLVNPCRVDLSDTALVQGENGGSVAYDAETKTLQGSMGEITGFVIMNPATERKDEYKYVEVTYLLEGGDVNAYLGDKNLQVNVGADAAGWSGEIKLNSYDIGEEVTVCFGAYGTLEDGAYINGVKFFNFGSETVMSIKAVTFYMDGKKSEPIETPPDNSESWVNTWETTEENFSASPSQMPQPLGNTTVRQIIKTTKSGDEFKLRLSNKYGKSDVTIHSLHLAKQVEADKSTIDVSTDTVVTVKGQEEFVIPAGEVIETDGVNFSVNELDNIAISAYFGNAPGTADEMTGHSDAGVTTYQVTGNGVSTETLVSPTTTAAWYFLADASVMSSGSD